MHASRDGQWVHWQAHCVFALRSEGFKRAVWPFQKSLQLQPAKANEKLHPCLLLQCDYPKLHALVSEEQSQLVA